MEKTISCALFHRIGFWFVDFYHINCCTGTCGSVANLVMMLPGYFEDTMNMIDKLLRSGTIPKEMLDSIGVYAAQIQDTLIKILRNGVPQLISMAGGFASGLANIGMALVIAVYLTISKDKLISQLKRFLYAFNEYKGKYVFIKSRKINECYIF